MTAQDYKVTFPYGATTAPYTPSRPHRGNDRAAPLGTPVVVQGVTIGLVGATGFATGSHLHTQAGTDQACQNTFDPTPLEFQAGTVVDFGYGSQWGNYITLKVGTKYITYCHLSKINVTLGQVIKKENLVKPTRNEVIGAFQKYARQNPTEDQIKHYMKRDTRVLYYDLLQVVQRSRSLKEQLINKLNAIIAVFKKG